MEYHGLSLYRGYGPKVDLSHVKAGAPRKLGFLVWLPNSASHVLEVPPEFAVLQVRKCGACRGLGTLVPRHRMWVLFGFSSRLHCWHQQSFGQDADYMLA